jgi:serine protease Do
MNNFTNEDELIDKYNTNQLSNDEKIAFNQLLNTNAAFKKKAEQTNEIIHDLLLQEETDNFKSALNFIETDLYKNDKAFKEEINLIRKISEKQANKKSVFIGAASAIIATSITLLALVAGGYIVKKQNTAYSELKRDLNILKGTQKAIINNISSKNKKGSITPGNFTATGFAISKEGYLLTSYHTIAGSDSIYVSNQEGDNMKAKFILGDAKLDIAILQLDNKDFLKDNIGFSLSNLNSNLGEKIFTLGFPSDNIVYGEGTLSSQYGYNGDTTAYQISIPVNPGNSGGPLFDESGKLIGVIKGKNNIADGTAYAVKSNEIVKFIDHLEDNSLKTALLSRKNAKQLNGKRTDQIKKLSNLVFQINVYKNN